MNLDLEQTARFGDPLTTQLLAIQAEHDRARVLASIECWSTPVQQEAPWDRLSDITVASDVLRQAISRYVAWGDDPLSTIRSQAWDEVARRPDLFTRSSAFALRVADDIECRLRGEPGEIPSSEGLPANPPKHEAA